MFAVPYCTQIARPKSLPITRYEPASAAGCTPPLRRQLRQRRHRPARLGLRPEERARSRPAAPPTPASAPRPRGTPCRDTARWSNRNTPCGPNACRQLLPRSPPAGPAAPAAPAAAAAPHRRRAAPDRPRPGATRPGARADAACPAAGSRGPCRTAAMWLIRTCGQVSRIIRAQYATRQLAATPARCAAPAPAAAARSSPRSSCRICHSGCGVPGAERRISCCSEPSGAR